jgi:hypothetical protein
MVPTGQDTYGRPLRSFADAIFPEFRELGPSVVGAVDAGKQSKPAPFSDLKNKALYASDRRRYPPNKRCTDDVVRGATTSNE